MFIPNELYNEPITCPYCLEAGNAPPLTAGILEGHLVGTHGIQDTTIVMWTTIEVLATRLLLKGR